MENTQNSLLINSNVNNINSLKSNNQKQQNSTYLKKFVSVASKVVKFIFYPLIIIYKALRSLYNYCFSTVGSTNKIISQDNNPNKIELKDLNFDENKKNNDNATLLDNNPTAVLETKKLVKQPQTQNQNTHDEPINITDNESGIVELTEGVQLETPTIQPIQLLDIPKFDAFLQASLSLKPNLEITNTILGAGSYGVVNLAKLYDPATETYKNVAVKTSCGNDDIETTKRSFMYEVLVGLKVKEDVDNFTQIIAAFDKTNTNGYQIVMELGDITLFQALKLFKDKNNILEADISGAIISRLIHSVKQCIVHNIYRLDTNNGNFLLFFEQNKLKISDFGEDTPYKQLSSKQCYRMIEKLSRKIFEMIRLQLPKSFNISEEYTEQEQKNIFETYFLPELNKSSISKESKDQIKQCFLKRFISLFYSPQAFPAMFQAAEYSNPLNASVAMHLLQGYDNFITATLGYRETFIADAKKLYERD